MLRLIRITALILIALSLAACQSETTETASIEPVSPATETLPAAVPPQQASTPFIEPLPSEVPSILRRDETTPAAQTETNVVTDEWPPRVSLEEAKKMLDQGTAVIVDVRAPQYFQERHIKGSLNIPLGELVLRANEIPQGKTVIAACT